MMHLPTEGNIFTAKPEPLAELLAGIHAHKIALPDFQCPWVWEPDMVRDLLISVAYRYPAGSLLTMPVTAATFALRPFEGAGEPLKSTPTLMVLDGQQRLTSLYQALYRRAGVQVKGRVYHFYLDIPLLMADPDGIEIGDPYFDKALYFIEEKYGKRIRYERFTLLYELTTTDHELAAGALPLSCVFDANGLLAEWRKAYLVKQANSDMTQYLELDNWWDRLVKPWLDRIPPTRTAISTADISENSGMLPQRMPSMLRCPGGKACDMVRKGWIPGLLQTETWFGSLVVSVHPWFSMICLYSLDKGDTSLMKMQYAGSGSRRAKNDSNTARPLLQ